MCRISQPFVTEARIDFAVRRAGEIADRRRHDSAFDCAATAVRQVFGRWLLDHTATVPPARLPLYLRLVDEVEQRLGLHRRRHGVALPEDPAAAAPWPRIPEAVVAAACA
ncbi:MAG: hypothetical protein Tsb0032_27720 [Kiloniellaceae bacterium]